MKIAELMNSKKKNPRVRVRVPAKLQEKLGNEVVGAVQGFDKKGRITWVQVKVARKGVFRFRPQDLDAA